MPNFFEENEDLKFNLEWLDLTKVVELREKGFVEAKQYDYAPANHQDALDSYRRVLELVGDGIDTVQTALAGYTLGANVENLTYTGTSTLIGCS